MSIYDIVLNDDDDDEDEEDEVKTYTDEEYYYDEELGIFIDANGDQVESDGKYV